jgi:hypothetical protein
MRPSVDLDRMPLVQQGALCLHSSKGRKSLNRSLRTKHEPWQFPQLLSVPQDAPRLAGPSVKAVQEQLNRVERADVLVVFFGDSVSEVSLAARHGLA